MDAVRGSMGWVPQLVRIIIGTEPGPASLLAMPPRTAERCQRDHAVTRRGHLNRSGASRRWQPRDQSPDCGNCQVPEKGIFDFAKLLPNSIGTSSCLRELLPVGQGAPVLILTRWRGQTIRIGGDITIRVLKVRPKYILIGIEAPGGLKVLRQELIGEKLKDAAGASPRGRSRSEQKARVVRAPR